MPMFEVTLPGFSGDTDDTDDLVIWVQAVDECAVRKHAIHGAQVVALPTNCSLASPDFVLPIQASEFVEAQYEVMSRFQNDHRVRRDHLDDKCEHSIKPRAWCPLCPLEKDHAC